MATPPFKMRCPKCQEDRLVWRVIDHDVSDLVGLASVVVIGLKALTCSKCKAVVVPGYALDQISLEVASMILGQTELEPDEARFLRKLLGDTQEEFAKRLDMNRITVNRWERGEEPITGRDAYAIRSLVFFNLREKSESIEAIAPAFKDPPTKKARRPRTYRIEGGALHTAV